MVERPIKKSDRPANSDTSNGTPPQPSREERQDRSARGRDKGKGKKGSREDKTPQIVNPALARPPKPGKAKAPIVLPEAETTEIPSETEATEVVADAESTEVLSEVETTDSTIS